MELEKYHCPGSFKNKDWFNEQFCDVHNQQRQTIATEAWESAAERKEKKKIV